MVWFLDNNLIGVITYQQAFRDYPDSWLLIKPIKRECYQVSKLTVLKQYSTKVEVLREARKRKRQGEDIAIICTIDEDEMQEEITPAEAAMIFLMYSGLAVPETYLNE